MSQRQDPHIWRLMNETEALQLQNMSLDEMMEERHYSDVNNEFTQSYDVQAILEELSQNIWSNDENSQFAGASGFHTLLLDSNPPYGAIIQAGIVPRLISFLQHPNEDIQSTSLKALAMIACNRPEDSVYLVGQGVLSEIMTLMSDPRGNLIEPACQILGNIASDSAELRDEAMRAGAMDAVLEILQRETAAKTALSALKQLCRGKPCLPLEEVRRVKPVVARWIESSDPEIVADALWVLASLSEGMDWNQAEVASEDVCRRLVTLLGTNDLSCLAAAVRTIGNLLSGDEGVTQMMIDSGVLETLKPLLSHPRAGLRKEACWSLSNVLAGNVRQIQAVIDAGMIPLILRLLSDRMDILRHAAWCLPNAISGASDEQIETLVGKFDIVPALCTGMLFEGEQDSFLVKSTLEAIERILRHDQNNYLAAKIEQAGGFDSLKRLTDVENQNFEGCHDIHELSKNILDTYFPM